MSATFCFAMEVGSDMPPWLQSVLTDQELFDNVDDPIANWKSVHWDQKIVSFGAEEDQAVNIIAQAYLSAGAKKLRSGNAVKTPIVTLFVYGDDYCTGAIVNLARERYKAAQPCEIKLLTSSLSMQ